MSFSQGHRKPLKGVGQGRATVAMVQEDYFAQKDARTKVGRPARRFCRCLPRGKKAYTKSSVPWQQGLGGKRQGEKHECLFSQY